MQEPPYDRYRHQPVYPERIGPRAVGQSIPLDRSQIEPIELIGPRAMPNESSRRRDSQLSPQFNNGAETYRDSVRGRDAAVRPASFERAERRRRDVRMRRLPPVR